MSLFTELWLPGGDGHRFYTRTYAASTPKAALLFVHGFAEHVERYDDFLSQWPQRGITVFAFDLRGFGRTALDAAHRSPDSAYGKTNWRLQLADVDWWAQHLLKENANVPIFLMGNSLGGELVLAFACQKGPSAPAHTISKISGVIAGSPLLGLVHPPWRITLWLGGQLAKILPDVLIPTSIPNENFSRDPAITKAIDTDNLRMPKGSLRGISDMLEAYKGLLRTGWKDWPKHLPVLLTHGSGDKVNTLQATEEFYQRIDADDKNLIVYPEAYHDLVHETDGIAERSTEQYISWVEAHVQR
ncbi:alpha beta-hydrolase [Auriscalpium vulgare]|uniref:Alpha beta-hydrolase n=1 Tax=Auriscalpium vulgare TaxID=40419 RepID=A0ACB8RRX8_9AGAM|nr:alpha beta-hydrolase [Auriscalpium vulgare]